GPVAEARAAAGAGPATARGQGQAGPGDREGPRPAGRSRPRQGQGPPGGGPEPAHRAPRPGAGVRQEAALMRRPPGSNLTTSGSGRGGSLRARGRDAATSAGRPATALSPRDRDDDHGTTVRPAREAETTSNWEARAMRSGSYRRFLLTAAATL